MKFGVLGPMLIERADGSAVSVPSARQRAVLAVLLIADGRTVSTDRLIDAVWGENLPANPIGTLQNSITHLRKALEPDRKRSDPPTVLLSSDGGYSLDLRRHDVDAKDFERNLEQAHSLFDATQVPAALETVTHALERWRGPAYADVPTLAFAEGERQRLAEIRVEAVELRIDCVGRISGPEATIPELESLIADHPYREGLWARLMTALYRVGRQADALQTYQRAASSLAEELGLEPSANLRRLEQQILQQDPQLETVDEPSLAAPSNNLPAPTSRLIGRDEELELILDVLGDARLVTLLGPGGSGKTRLAIEVGRHLCEPSASYPDGIWLVRLDDLDDPVLLESSIGAVVNMPESAGRTVRETLIAHIKDKELLLVLDNCEHLAAPVASLVGELIQRCSGLTILATSQSPLNLSGEQRLEVRPLALPGDEGGLFVALDAAPAVQLFIERARQIQPGRVFDEPEIQAIANIVQTLDGLPLAIELAAARTVSLSANEIARLLSDRFGLLTGGPGDAPQRQQALASTVAWSYNLLEPKEQAFFAQLAVFVGTFDVEAAATVTGLAETQIVDVLDRLVSSSLIQRHGVVLGTSRFRMLETLRQYGIRQLIDSATEAVTRQRHAGFFASRAEALNQQLEGPEQDRAITALAGDEDNYRAAMTWALDVGRSDQQHLAEGIRIVTGLGRFWDWRGALAEANTWLDRFMTAAAEHDEPSFNRGGLVWWHSYFVAELGDFDRAAALTDLAMALTAEEDDRGSYAAVLAGKAMTLRVAGEPEEALLVGAFARAAAEEADHRWLVALTYSLDALAQLALGDLDAASIAADRTQAEFEILGDRRATAWSMTARAQVMLARGDLSGARDQASQAMAISAQAKDGRNTAWSAEVAAAAARADDDPDGAAALEAEAAALLSERGMQRAPWQPE